MTLNYNKIFTIQRSKFYVHEGLEKIKFQISASIISIIIQRNNDLIAIKD